MRCEETMNESDSFAVWRTQFTVETSQCDLSGSWKLSSLMVKMQDAANEHCRALGVVRNDLTAKNAAWVLFKSDIVIDRYPGIGERLNVQTFTKGAQMKFYPRYYVMTDAQGAVFCRAGSLWMLMDKTTRKTLTQSESGVTLPHADMDAPVKISPLSKQIQGIETKSQYRPQYSDIDVNGHVNNTRYGEWLCNQLGIEFMKRHAFGVISIDYSYEVLPDDLLDCALVMNDREIQYSGYAQGKKKFSIYCGTRPRIVPDRGKTA